MVNGARDFLAGTGKGDTDVAVVGTGSDLPVEDVVGAAEHPVTAPLLHAPTLGTLVIMAGEGRAGLFVETEGVFGSRPGVGS